MKQVFFAGLSISMIFISCKKSDTNDPASPITVPTSPITNTKGSVILLDEDGAIVKNNGGTIVSLESSNFTKNLPVNNQGQFELPVLEETQGKIALTYSHPGFATFKEYYYMATAGQYKKRFL